MTKQFFAVLTHYGTQTIASAVANKQPLKITHMAVGDGNGSAVVPTAAQTKLTKEVYRSTISAVSVDPRNNKQVIFELTIPETVGGFYVREMGIFDSNNKLVAIANCPESYKPALASGSGKVQVLRMILTVSASDAITLTVDDTVIFVTRGQLTPQTITATSANGFDNNGHTHEIDKADTTKAGIVQLTNDTGLDSEKLALTARVGRKLAQLIASVQQALNNYIPLNNRSSAVNSTSNEKVATSAAVKTAYDKGVEAKTAADKAQQSANAATALANTKATANVTVKDLNSLSVSQFFGCLDTAMGVPSDVSGTNVDLNGIHADAGYQKFQMLVVTQKDIRIRYNDDGTNWSSWEKFAMISDVKWATLKDKPSTATRWPSFSEVTGRPTTIAGYGITDHNWATLKDKPATATRWPSFGEVTSRPTTIAGYGITDHNWATLKDKPATATRWPSFGEVTSRPTTISGYGITDHNWATLKDKPATATRWPAWNEVSGKPQVVQDVRLGATVSRKLENKEWQTHGAGYVVTGFYNYSDDLHANDWVYLKPVQKNINGTWVTVANA